MRRLLLAALIITAVVGVALPVSAAPPTPSGTISINEPGPYAFGDTVTFTTTSSGLKGYQYPMVYLVCTSDIDGSVLYGQLDYPNVAFPIGGGSSPWWVNPEPTATCVGKLYVYGHHDIIPLAQTAAFASTGP